jgi:hypothetical protein
VWIVYRAIRIRAYGYGLPCVATKDDDGVLGGGAWRLGVRVVGRIEFAVLVLLQGSGTLLLRVAPCCLKLDKLRLRGEFTVDMRRDLHLVARRVKALCGIRATGKYFPPARHRQAPRVKRRSALQS